MDAGKFYALLRFEEAALALRTALRMNLVDSIGKKELTHNELRDELGFTEQAARTFFTLLQVMEILERENDLYRITPLAAECLGNSVPTSRKPYLGLGSEDDCDEMIALFRGNKPADSIPLYGGEHTGPTVMDEYALASEIAHGLASRARNFAEPLAAAIAERFPQVSSIADIGAGSPFVAQACLHRMPHLTSTHLVDRSNGMHFVHEIIGQENIDTSKMEFHEIDFFTEVPPAELYILSNTAHDWQPAEYSTITNNILCQIPENGIVCIHEPLLMTEWDNDSEWIRALWMACYAMTLLRITLGEGTCYTVEEHNTILAQSGFQPLGQPSNTNDGCTALFYNLADE